VRPAAGPGWRPVGVISAFRARTEFGAGEERATKANLLAAGSQRRVQEKRLLAEGFLEPEECLGFVLALPKICPFAFLTHVARTVSWGKDFRSLTVCLFSAAAL